MWLDTSRLLSQLWISEAPFVFSPGRKSAIDVLAVATIAAIATFTCLPVKAGAPVYEQLYQQLHQALAAGQPDTPAVQALVANLQSIDPNRAAELERISSLSSADAQALAASLWQQAAANPPAIAEMSVSRPDEEPTAAPIPTTPPPRSEPIPVAAANRDTNDVGLDYRYRYRTVVPRNRVYRYCTDRLLYYSGDRTTIVQTFPHCSLSDSDFSLSGDRIHPPFFPGYHTPRYRTIQPDVDPSTAPSRITLPDDDE
jgi:hypothetical protein